MVSQHFDCFSTKKLKYYLVTKKFVGVLKIIYLLFYLLTDVRFYKTK